MIIEQTKKGTRNLVELTDNHIDYGKREADAALMRHQKRLAEIKGFTVAPSGTTETQDFLAFAHLKNERAAVFRRKQVNE